MKLISRLGKIPWQTPAGWVASVLVAYVHIYLAMVVIPYNLDTVQWLFPLALIVPGVIIMIALKGGGRRWYRWVVLIGLALTTSQDNLQGVLFIAEAWIIHRQCVTEAPGGIKANLRWRLVKAVDQQAPVATKNFNRNSRKTKTA